MEAPTCLVSSRGAPEGRPTPLRGGARSWALLGARYWALLGVNFLYFLYFFLGRPATGRYWA